jgi:hypothetical protein
VAYSIDVGSERVRQLKKALGDDAPALDLRITGVIRKGSSVATPAAECDEIHVGDKLIGSYVAIDRHFLHARLHLQRNPNPNPPSSSAPPQLLGVADNDDLNPYGQVGGSWELDTTHMQPSGYTLTLRVFDRTLLGSSTITRWSGSIALDFHLAPPRMLRPCGNELRPVAYARHDEDRSPRQPTPVRAGRG